MQTTPALIASCLLLPTTLLNCLVIIYLSICHVKTSLLQMFSLYLCFPTLAYCIFASARLVVKIATEEDIDLTATAMIVVDKKTSFDYFSNVVLYLCGYNYRLLAILLVAVTYLFYAKPVFAMKHLTNRKIAFLFPLVELMTVTVSVVATFSNRQAGELLNDLPVHPLIWNDVFEGVFEFTSLLVLFFKYFECARVLIKYKSSQSGNLKTMKTQLICALAYITPPNLFLIPNSICTDLFTVLFGAPPVMRQLCEIKIFYDDMVLQGRLFIATVTVLIAFADYRSAVHSSVRKCLAYFNEWKVSTHVTKVGYFTD